MTRLDTTEYLCTPCEARRVADALAINDLDLDIKTYEGKQDMRPTLRTTARRLNIYADNFPVCLLYQGETYIEMARTYDAHDEPVDVLYRADADGRALIVQYDVPSDEPRGTHCTHCTHCGKPLEILVDDEQDFCICCQCPFCRTLLSSDCDDDPPCEDCDGCIRCCRCTPDEEGSA